MVHRDWLCRHLCESFCKCEQGLRTKLQRTWIQRCAYRSRSWLRRPGRKLGRILTSARRRFHRRRGRRQSTTDNTYSMQQFVTDGKGGLVMFFGGHKSFLWDHWFNCSELLISPAQAFKAKMDSLACVPSGLHAVGCSDSHLVWHLLSSWWPAWQLSLFDPHTCQVQPFYWTTR